MLVRHSARDSLDELLEEAITGGPTVACHGPVYKEDPATVVLEPFRRSAESSGWSIQGDIGLAPPWALKRAGGLRYDAWRRHLETGPDVGALVDWTRAGLVLMIAERHGVRCGGSVRRPLWDLNGTVTTRFGCTTVDGFCPLRISAAQRPTVVSGIGGLVAVLDFKAIDLCSMLSLEPGLRRRYAGADDPHMRTADIVFDGPGDDERALAKIELFVHAYGGRSPLASQFDRRIPELKLLRSLNDGDPGATARLVQTRSAKTFRAALSEALPLLIYDDLRPMFVVHDELVLDVTPGSVDLVADVALAMERGAARSSGVAGHRVGIGIGRDYADAKG